MLERTILFTVFTSVLDMDITESSGYRDFMWAVELHRLGLEMIGLWPKIEKSTKRSLWPEIQIGIILILLIFVSIPMVCAVTNVWGNMVLVIDNLHFTLPMLTVLIKYVVMQWKRTVFFAIVSMMAEDWIAFKHFTERNVMVRRAQSARLIMIYGYFFVVMGFLVINVPPYFGIQFSTSSINRSKMLPLESYHFYDTDKSPQYELTFLIQVITTLLAATIYMSIDISLMLIILHICGQLEIFRCRLVNLVLCKNFYKVLNNIIVTHMRLIKFAENIENMYSLLMLIMVFYFSIVFCLNGFLFAVFFINKTIDHILITKICYSSLLLFALWMNTFLYCSAGELVMEQCNAIYRALYDLEWYNLESRKARNLILLMIRTYHPFRITAGKIIPLTMATFCSVLKTSCGYISFLLTKHD